MNGLCVLLIGQGINVYLVRNHKRGIKAQSEVADDLIRIALVLVFLYEISSTGKSNLVDILIHLVRRHSQAVVDEGKRLLLRIHDNLHPGLIALGQSVLPHHIQLFQLGHGIAAVGNQFPVKNIMVGIQPFLDNRKNIFAVD